MGSLTEVVPSAIERITTLIPDALTAHSMSLRNVKIVVASVASDWVTAGAGPIDNITVSAAAHCPAKNVGGAEAVTDGVM